ncbi:hypothetical protein [Paenibacillus abyssi]|uniref:Uncharacterized protein n=1 Tax=Paenibacillus abyssi TaxID=1340531 RepID=A0A917G1Q4_9BACL|nr:hypothetical protein [Paenibacillus abyssi]GGG18655.1 hypothetical protein GCM10010916_39320 [Paenibacillus abyssi]
MKPQKRFNLISDRLQEIASPQRSILGNLFGRLSKTPTVGLRLRFPQYDYLRAEMFVEDLLELCDYEITFQVDDLISILYKDFLVQVAQGTNQKQLLIKLKEKQDRHFRVSDKVAEYVWLNPNHLHRTEKNVPRKVKYLMMEMQILRKAALRGEVFLMDLSQLDPEFTLTLDQLISILFIDFVSELKSGNDADLVQNIIAHLRDG